MIKNLKFQLKNQKLKNLSHLKKIKKYKLYKMKKILRKLTNQIKINQAHQNPNKTRLMIKLMIYRILRGIHLQVQLKISFRDLVLLMKN